MRLTNKVALITGGSSGIGRSSAIKFAREGAKVMVADWKRAGEKTVEEIHKLGGVASFIQGDISREHDCKNIVEKTVEAYQGIDILYNNAGVWLPGDGPSPDLQEEIWNKVIDINLKGTYLMCKYVIPEMVRTGGGSIINVTSISALRAGKDIFDAYAASKGGVISLSKTMASTWGPKNIRVNVICPGSICTSMTEDSYTDRVMEYWKKHIPLGRIGKPEEVAELALFLSSDESSYISGVVILVDGGYMTR